AGPANNPGTTTIGGVSVSVCGVQATLCFTSGPAVAEATTRWQINALMPDQSAMRTSCPVVVTVDGQASAPLTLDIDPNARDLFAFDTTAGRFPLLTHADYPFAGVLVGPASLGMIPAWPGGSLIAWGTGNCQKPTVSVNAEPVSVQIAQSAAAGICQTRFTVPTNLLTPATLQLDSSADTYRIPLFPSPIRESYWGWLFADAKYDLLGWTGEQVSELRQESGLLIGRAAGTDPQLIGPWFYGGDRGFSKVIVRMQVSQNSVVDLFWAIQDKTGFNGADQVRFNSGSGGMREYVIAIRSPRSLAGEMVMLRLDPTTAANVEFRIESIRVEE
ncbi:MAG: hypothetical protein NTY38_28700, partial [Acidobacteria bacterium]|nr:hypothetical protein [Acidobacteriota bacterium]